MRRRTVYHRDVEYGPIDLSFTYLRQADIRNASLQGTDLWDELWDE
jgi:hypothetical protein